MDTSIMHHATAEKINLSSTHTDPLNKFATQITLLYIQGLIFLELIFS